MCCGGAGGAVVSEGRFLGIAFRLDPAIPEGEVRLRDARTGLPLSFTEAAGIGVRPVLEAHSLAEIEAMVDRMNAVLCGKGW